MKILILVNTTEYPYHKMVIEDFHTAFSEYNLRIGSSYESNTVDFSSKVLKHMLYKEINQSKADLILNLDFAGFVLRTEGGSISLNDFHTRIVNIMFQKDAYYSDELGFRQNLSMFTYFPNRIVNNEEELKRIADKYPGIPNLGVMCEYNHKAQSESEKSMNQSNLNEWITTMIKNVMYLY